MILAKAKSDWLKQYLQDEGGAITVEFRLVVVD
jgi:hypothetical protein